MRVGKRVTGSPRARGRGLDGRRGLARCPGSRAGRLGAPARRLLPAKNLLENVAPSSTWNFQRKYSLLGPMFKKYLCIFKKFVYVYEIIRFVYV